MLAVALFMAEIQTCPFLKKESGSSRQPLRCNKKNLMNLMAHSYSHLYKLSATGLRFFTVYGPWGRPDMALFLLQNQY